MGRYNKVGAHAVQDCWVDTEAGGRAGRLKRRVEVEAVYLVARATRCMHRAARLAAVAELVSIAMESIGHGEYSHGK